MRRKFLDRLIESRFSSKKEIREILDQHKRRQRQQRRRHPNKYIQGVHNGVFFRIKVPPKKKVLPDIPKLPPPQAPPKAFKSVPKDEGSMDTIRQAREDWSWTEFSERLRLWWKENWPVLVLNFGSLCTLVGFTRSDVLELRTLSVTGSLSSVVYFLTQKPIRYTPIAWSLTFACVNATKIFQILQERKGTVHLTAKQERVYIDFFMPHGVTPKQFEIIEQSAEVLHIPKGQCIIRQGDQLEYVYLVIEGSTRANILGRHLTAASAIPQGTKTQRGGASGAWIGEMAFLESYWIKEQNRHRPVPSDDEDATKDVPPTSEPAFVTQPLAVVQSKKPPVSKDLQRKVTGEASTGSQQHPGADEEASPKKPVKMSSQPPIEPKSGKSLYTIVTNEDCTVLRWSHADMERLMEHSTDLRAALTRTMSANIVGKVINLTVSRSNAMPTWSTWLDDWKHSGAVTRVEVEDQREEYHLEGEDGEEPPVSAPEHPIKKFGPTR